MKLTDVLPHPTTPTREEFERDLQLHLAYRVDNPFFVNGRPLRLFETPQSNDAPVLLDKTVLDYLYDKLYGGK